MNKTLLGILLAASVGFNAFFLIGQQSARRTLEKLRTPEGRTEYMTRELGLDARQQESYRSLGKTFENRAIELRQSLPADLEDRFWAEAVKDRPDRAVLRELLAQVEAPMRDLGWMKIEVMLDFFQVLTPDQRRRFGDLTRAHQVP